MINTSTEYKRAALEDRRFTAKIVCLLKNGTTLHFDETNLVAAGMKIADGTSANNSFTIGSAIINQLTVQINNSDEKFSDYDFTDARLTVSVGMKLADRIEWLKKGVFVSEDPTTTPSVITIKAFDNMRKFDKTYDGKLSFPCNLQAIVQYCCDKCGMMMGDSRFPNYDYVIPENPFEDKSSVTYRAILSYCAMIACCFARCNVDGQLELKWYDTAAFDGFNRYDGGYFDRTDKSTYQSGVSVDGGNFTDYTSGDSVDGGDFLEELPFHHIYSLSSLEVSTEDVVITGIKVQATDGVTSAGKKLEGETYLCGAEGYVLSISGNPLIRYGKAKEIATYIGSKALGMRFRPLKANALGDPSWEAGDAAVVTDRKNNSYQCYITNLTYAIGAYANLQCDAEPAKRHSADRYAEIQKIVADIKKDSQQELDLYTQYVERMNQLAMNAMGYYETTEVMDDGSTITYMHDKPLLKDSKIVYKKTIDGFFWSKDGGKTYTGGIDKNGNAVMNVIATIGLQADWINTGRFTAKDAKGVTKFLVDADTGLVEIHPDTFTMAGKTVDDIAAGAASSVADAAVKKLNDELNMTEVFNRLTNNGKIKGLYMKNNQLYINASYILSGILKLGGANNVNGLLQVLDSANTEVCRLDQNGAKISGNVTIINQAKHSGSSGSNVIAKFGEVQSDYYGWNVDGFKIYNSSYSSEGVTIAPRSYSASYDNPTLIHSKSGARMSCDGSRIEYNPSAVSLVTGGNTVNDGIHVGLNKSQKSFTIGTNLTLMKLTDNPVELLIQGALRATGGKTRIIKTDNYETVTLNAVESPDCNFQDFGGGIIDSSGKGYVFFDPIFSETINLNYGYRVQITKTNNYEIKYVEKKRNYFIVMGDPGAAFDWVVTAKQKGYENDRMERYEIDKDEIFYDDVIFEHASAIEEDAYKYLYNFEREVMNYD